MQRVVTALGIVYSRPPAEPRSRLAQLIARPLPSDDDDAETVAPAAHEGSYEGGRLSGVHLVGKMFGVSSYAG
jgi:hypothetical protein